MDDNQYYLYTIKSFSRVKYMKYYQYKSLFLKDFILLYKLYWKGYII